jgi:hypothetical protein
MKTKALSVFINLSSIINILKGSLPSATENPFRELTPLFLNHFIAMQHLLVATGKQILQWLLLSDLSCMSIILLWIVSQWGLYWRSKILIRCESECIYLVGIGEHAASADVETCFHEIRPSLDGSIGHIEIVASVSGSYILMVLVYHLVLFFLVLAGSLLLERDDSSEDHDLLTGDLHGSCMQDAQLLLLSYIVQHLPVILIDIIDLNLGHILISLLTISWWAFLVSPASEHEDILIIQ